MVEWVISFADDTNVYLCNILNAGLIYLLALECFQLLLSSTDTFQVVLRKNSFQTCRSLPTCFCGWLEKHHSSSCLQWINCVFLIPPSVSLTLQITAVMEITTTDSSGGLPWVIIPDFESFSTSNIYHQGHRKHAAVSCDTERNEEFPSGTNVTLCAKTEKLEKSLSSFHSSSQLD